MAKKKTGARKVAKRPGKRPRAGTDGGTPKPWGQRQPGGGWVQAAGPKKPNKRKSAKRRAVKLLKRVRNS